MHGRGPWPHSGPGRDGTRRKHGDVRAGATNAEREIGEIAARRRYVSCFLRRALHRFLCVSWLRSGTDRAARVLWRISRAELKSQLKQERQERQALERELEECKQQMAEAGLL